MNNNEEMTVPEKLYHYTSKEGFLGIIENKTLWASEILFMNDGKETCIPLEILKELLKDDKNVNIKEKIGRDGKDSLELYESFRGFETYVISFSEKKDDLNMWRAYGDNASGVCIEFNTCELLEVLEKNQKIKSMKWRKCIYDKQEQKNKIQSLLNSVTGSNDFNRSGLFEGLIEFSTYFKHESFRDEHEWRIVVQLNTDLKNREVIKVRTGKNVFVPYCELRIEEDKLHSESEDKYPWLGDITVGPAIANPDLFYESVLQACFVHGIGFCKAWKRDLLKSDIPYRG